VAPLAQAQLVPAYPAAGPRYGVNRMVSDDQPVAADGDAATLPSPRSLPVVPALPPGAVVSPEAFGQPHDGMDAYGYGNGHGLKAPFPAAPVPKEFRKQALPSYVVEPPDILLIQGSTAISKPLQPLQGQHLVRPDGTISMGIYGTLFVAGQTVEQIKTAIAVQLQSGLGEESPAKKFSLEKIKSELDVDVLAYNSKFYYIITDGGGYGAQVFRLPVTGNETVLDALAQVNGLPPVASKKHIWVARATPGDHEHPKILPVDWCGLTQRGSAATNYQIYPNDRIYVQSDALIRTDTLLAKFLSPIQRVFGATLLGATTVNTIKGGTGVSNGATR
jgi:polysaccharide export outer membrane protein